jgi:hypothetical protein
MRSRFAVLLPRLNNILNASLYSGKVPGDGCLVTQDQT